MARETQIPLSRLHQGVACRAVQALAQLLQAFFHLVLSSRDELGCSGRSGSAQVGDEVRNREVGFVPDGGDDGDLRGSDGARQRFAVKGREIFERSASAGQNDDVDFACAVEPGDAGLDFERRRVALDKRGIDEDLQRGVPAGDDVDEVANDGSRRAR